MSIVPQSGFIERLSAQFEISRSIDAGSLLHDELGLDSISTMMLYMWVESLANADSIPDDPPVLLTVGDAYSYYLSLAASDLHGA